MTNVKEIGRFVVVLAWGAVIGAVIVLSTGCNMISGLGHDVSQTSDMLHRGIKSYYSNHSPTRDRGYREARRKDNSVPVVGEVANW